MFFSSNFLILRASFIIKVINNTIKQNSIMIHVMIGSNSVLFELLERKLKNMNITSKVIIKHKKIKVKEKDLLCLLTIIKIRKNLVFLLM